MHINREQFPCHPIPFIKINAMPNRDRSENPKSINPVPKNPGVIEIASHRSLFGTRLDSFADKPVQDSTQIPSKLNNGKVSLPWPFY
jgi:hypothetical protein